MPITKSDPRIFNKDFDIKSLDDIANVVANEWVVLLRQSLQKNNRVSTGTLEASLVPDIEQSPSYIKVNILDTTELFSFGNYMQGRYLGLELLTSDFCRSLLRCSCIYFTYPTSYFISERWV